MTETLIPIHLIDANPYQPRKQEDPQAVEELALDILHHATPDFDGLMQVPTVRAVNGRYQLAFGHTRKAAFAYLVESGQSRYEEMRVNVRELDDVQMFELAVAENIKRRDLNPLDQAEAICLYMDEFGKTSKEAGEFFGMAEETIRQKRRLPNLPEIAKAKMRQGELNESAGRALLTLTRILPNDEEALNNALESIADGDKPEEAVGDRLRFNKNTVTLSDGKFHTQQKTFKYLPALIYSDLRAVVDPESDEYMDDELEDILQKMSIKGAQPETDAEKKALHLIKPPACTACPMFAKVDGFMICGWKACHDRKLQAQQDADLHSCSEKHGIAVYAESDGKAALLNRWNDEHKAMVNKKLADLRITHRGNYANQFFENEISVVVVGETLKKMEAKQKKAREAEKSKNTSAAPKVDYERLRAIQKIIDGQEGLFLWETLAPAFAVVLSGVTQIDFLDTLADHTSAGSSFDLPKDAFPNQKAIEALKKPARLEYHRRQVIVNMLDNLISHNEMEKIHKSKSPTMAYLAWAKNQATTWGVKLPKDFEKKAQEHDEAIKLAIAEYDKSRGAQ